MNLSKTFIAAAVALTMGVPVAQAQRRSGGEHSRGGGGGQSGSRSAAPRAGGGQSGSARAVTGPTRSSAYGGSRTYGSGSRGGVVVGRSAPRIIGAPRGVRVAPVRFYQPYYTFRPRVSLGFGLWVGFPITYPYYYGYYDPYYSPYTYPAPYPAYGYPYPATTYPPYPPTPYPPSGYPPSAYPQSGYPAPPGSVGVQGPNHSNTGGLSFEITPNTAEVFVDGQDVGQVGQFTATSQPLALTPGRHHIEIRAAGYRTIDFETDIVAGQVIPYQGALER
jgi:hypothetical protein